MKITFKQKGSFKNTERYLSKLKGKDYLKRLEHYGDMGVKALADATPIDSGLTANSWTYDVIIDDEKVSLVWRNTNVQDEWYVVAIGIQHGHATGTGGWVEGIDYINPAMKPVFETIADAVSAEIKGL